MEGAEGDRRGAALTVQRIDETITDGVDRQVAIGPDIGELALIRCLALRIGIAAAPVQAQQVGHLELAGHLCVDQLALIPGARLDRTSVVEGKIGCVSVYYGVSGIIKKK